MNLMISETDKTDVSFSLDVKLLSNSRKAEPQKYG